MYYQLKALILRAETQSEADKVVTAYTLEWGKISAIVPGARKIKAKLAASTEPLTESDLMVYLSHPSVRPKVTGAAIIENHSALKTEWRRLVLAQYCGEVLAALTPFNAENPKKYELLARTWDLLATAKNPWRIFAAFTLRFLKLSGYSFTEYLKREQTAIPRAEQELIRKLATLSGAAIDTGLEMDPETEWDIKRHIENYLNLYLPRPLASREFVHKVLIADSKIAAVHRDVEKNERSAILK